MSDDQSSAVQRALVQGGVIQQPPPAPPAAVGDGEDDGPKLPMVRLPGDGRIAYDFNREVGTILMGRGAYRYKDGVVTIERNEKTGRMETPAMTAHRFRDWVERGHLVCYKEIVSRHGVLKQIQTMAVEHAETCLQSDTFRKLQPRLVRVNEVRLPIMRRDGSIELLPEGYDDESGIYTTHQAWEYDEEMTLAEAVAVFDDLDREFPFQDQRSRAVFRCAMLSQFGYHLQAMDAKRLGFLFHANGSRSGKTLLVELALTAAWRYASVDAMPDDTAKLRDRLDTAVREAYPYVVFDDLEQSYLRSGMLNAFMSASWWSGRKFHSQSMFTEPKTAVVFLTANNLEVTPDIAGRTLTCDLFTAEADPQARQVSREIDADWLRQPNVHKQVCSAMWTIVKHWRDTGRNHGGRTMKGYGEWSRIFGGMTIAAGFGDPCAARESDSFGNTEFADMQALMNALGEGVQKAAEYEFIDIVNYCRELNCFPHMIKGKLVKSDAGDGFDFIPSDETNSAFGKTLGRYGGRSFVLKDGRRLVFDKRGKNRHRRYVVTVGAVGSE